MATHYIVNRVNLSKYETDRTTRHETLEEARKQAITNMVNGFGSFVTRVDENVVESWNMD